jgi:hypothetical protein
LSINTKIKVNEVFQGRHPELACPFLAREKFVTHEDSRNSIRPPFALAFPFSMRPRGNKVNEAPKRDALTVEMFSMAEVPSAIAPNHLGV